MSKIITSAKRGAATPSITTPAQQNVLLVPESVFSDVYTDDPHLVVETVGGKKRIALAEDTRFLLEIEETHPSVLNAPLQIAGNRVVTVDSTNVDGEGRLTLFLDSAGHEKNGFLQIIIPANVLDQRGKSLGANSITAPDVWNANGWDTYDPTKTFILRVECTSISPLAFDASLRLENSPDVNPPTIVSAIVQVGTPDKLVTNYNKKVKHPLDALDGYSVQVAVGAPVSFNGISSGNGTSSVTYGLSRTIVGSDSLSLNIAGQRTLQDLNGNKIGTGTTPIDSSSLSVYAMPGQTHLWRGDVMSTSGSDVTGITDQTGTLNLAPPATKPTTTTVGGRPAFTIIAGSYLKGDLAGSETPSAFAYLIVYNATTAPGTYANLFSASLASNVVLTAQELTIWKAIDYVVAQRDGQGGTGVCETFSGGVNNNNDHSLLFTGDNAGAKVYRDGVQIISSSVSFTAVAIKRFCIGIKPDLSSAPATGIKIAEVRTGNQKLTGGDLTTIASYVNSRYGI